MGKKVNPAPLPYEHLALYAFYADQLAPGNMPKDGHLRGRILKALIERIRNFYPEDVNHCFGSIAVIAKFEAVPDHRIPPEEKEKNIQAFLYKLASQPPSRPKHNKEGIRAQQDFLHDFLTREGYDVQRTGDTRMSWIRKHWDRLIAGLSLRPCLCEYRTDIEGFTKTAQQSMGYLIGIRNATDLLLAYLHNRKTVSPDNFRKTLKAKR